jgi:hypothetical protein
MKYFFYKFSDNWADEMDLEGFAILTETQKDIALAKIKREYKRGGSISFGTNEDNDYDSLEDVMDCIEIKEIATNEYFAIKKVFGGISMGELGPLSIYDIDDDDYDEDEDYETCDNCGRTLEDGEDDLCESCADEDQYEEEYEAQAEKIVDYITKAYGLEKSNTYDNYARFHWKPTPKTEIEITIADFDDGEEEVELTLKMNNKELKYEFFKVEDIYDNPGKYLESVIKEFIERAKKY